MIHYPCDVWRERELIWYSAYYQCLSANQTFRSALRAASTCANWLMQPRTKYPIIKKINQVQSLEKSGSQSKTVFVFSRSNKRKVIRPKSTPFQKPCIISAASRLDFVRLASHSRPDALRSVVTSGATRKHTNTHGRAFSPTNAR